MSCRKWIFSNVDKEYAASIAERYDVNPFAAVLLASKNFDEDEIDAFLCDDVAFNVDPYELPDMDKAVRRIRQAIENFERIMIYGDYDADGVSSTALLYLYLRSQGADVMYYIPDRLTEGYGMNLDAVRRIKERGVNLIITVDNGISAIIECEKIKALGMDIVITDHHRPGDILPKACAVVDPYRSDFDIIFREWAGVGVAFKLVEALSDFDEEVLYQYADLVTIGTIGDVVPLINENRSFVKCGIDRLNTAKRPGISALKRVAGIDSKNLSASNIAFTLIPRINAAGRMGSADDAVKLLLSENEEEATEWAQKINSANVTRQKIEMSIVEEAEEIIEKSATMKYDRVLVVSGENWHSGVIGIVAARLTEKYARPCLVISVENGVGKGSGRSIEGFSLFESLKNVSDCLDHFGGHTLAAGFQLEESRIDELRIKINEYASNMKMPVPTVKIDCRISPDYVNVDLLDELYMFEPYGAGNNQPVFAMMKMHVDRVEGLSHNKHTKVYLSKKGANIAALKFNVSPQVFDFCEGDTVDVAVTLDKNEYMGNVSVSVIIKDIRFSRMDEDAVIASQMLYEKFRRQEKLTLGERALICPDRDFIGKIYRVIKSCVWEKSSEALAHRIGDDGRRVCTVKVAIDVLSEMGLIEKDINSNGYIPTKVNGKVDLTQSKILRSLQEV